MKLDQIHPRYASWVKDLKSYAKEPSLWRAEAKQALREAKKGYKSVDTALAGLSVIQRLRWVFTAGIENNGTFKREAEMLASHMPTWKDYAAPPADKALQKSLADKLFAHVSHDKWDKPIIALGNGSKYIGPLLVKKAMKGEFPALIDFSDRFSSLVRAYADENGIRRLATSHLADVNDTNMHVVCRGGQQEMPPRSENKGNEKLYSSLTKTFNDRRSTGESFYTLTAIPSPADAKADGLSYEDLVRLHFEMVDQPWDAIGKAQEQLIAELDAAKTIRFTNNDGTDVTMDIDGFTFCNSLIAKNVPGSEAFSAPRVDSVNGTIVAKGRFIVPGKGDKGFIENLTMTFNKGALVGYSADKGLDIFEDAIGIDEGAKHIGEVAIGTNPHLKRHVTNGLLVEKIGGSFHVALGQAYQYTDYMGKAVHLNNGNKSMLHWDITTMLYGKEGTIELDGRKIMQDGKFIDPKYDVLNRGWSALPEAERPDYWKKNEGPFRPTPAVHA